MLKLEDGGYFYQGLAKVKLNGKWSFINKTGKLICQAQFDEVRDFSGGLAAVNIGGSDAQKWGFINKTGQLIAKPQFDGIDNFCEGFAAVNIGGYETGKWGFIDHNGELVVQAKYDRVMKFSQGLAAVKYDGKWGFINQLGEVVLSPQFVDVQDFSEGLAPICVEKDIDNKGKWGFINHKLENVISPSNKFRGVRPFQQGLAPIETGFQEYGYIDKSGNIVIPPIFSFTRNFVEDLAIVGYTRKINGQLLGTFGEDDYGDRSLIFYERPQSVTNTIQQKAIINKKGDIVKTYEYNWEKVDDFKEGMAVLCVKDGYSYKYGFVNKLGNCIIPCKFSYALYFSEGLAAVNTSRNFNDTPKWKYIDKVGNVVINVEASQASPFREGLAVIKCKDTTNSSYNYAYFIDKTGKNVFE